MRRFFVSRPIGALSMVAVAAGLAACGGGDDTTPTTTAIPQLAAAQAGTLSAACASLTGFTYAGVTIDSAATVPAGTLTLAEFNACAAAFKPQQMQGEYRFICDTTAKYAAGSEAVQALYRLEQVGTPLAGKGAGLSRDDVEQLRSNRA